MYRFPHRLAIAAIMKDEAPYIVEWLSYHKAAGVSKFFLYDNGSTDNTVELIKPFIKEGIVELNVCILPAAQMQVYQDAIRRSRYICEYLAVIDIDEFILPINGKYLPDAVADTLKEFPEKAGVAMPWRFFGSANKMVYEPEEVTKRFQYRAKDEFKPNRQTKIIFNPRLASYMITPHNAHFFWRNDVITGDGIPVKDILLMDGQKGNIFTYHYFVKSYEEFEVKQKRGTADGTAVRTMKNFYEYDKNDVFDDSAWKYFKQTQVRPYRIISEDAVKRENNIYVEGIINGQETSLSELLCYLFYSRHIKDMELCKVILNKLLQFLIGNKKAKREDISLFITSLPDIIEMIRNVDGNVNKKWYGGICEILDNGIFESRCRYLTQELNEFLYTKSMLRLLMNG